MSSKKLNGVSSKVDNDKESVISYSGDSYEGGPGQSPDAQDYYGKWDSRSPSPRSETSILSILLCLYSINLQYSTQFIFSTVKQASKQMFECTSKKM